MFPCRIFSNVYNHAVGFALCGLSSDEYLNCHGFRFLLFLYDLDTKLVKGMLEKMSGRQLECYKYCIYPFRYCLTYL
jgi:hypothetical protein